MLDFFAPIDPQDQIALSNISLVNQADTFGLQNRVFLYERLLRVTPSHYDFVDPLALRVFGLFISICKVSHVVAPTLDLRPLLIANDLDWRLELHKMLASEITWQAMYFHGCFKGFKDLKPFSYCGDAKVNALAKTLKYPCGTFSNISLLRFSYILLDVSLEHKGDLIECVLGHDEYLFKVFASLLSKSSLPLIWLHGRLPNGSCGKCGISLSFQ
jgi:hypothetical protein